MEKQRDLFGLCDNVILDKCGTIVGTISMSNVTRALLQTLQAKMTGRRAGACLARIASHTRRPRHIYRSDLPLYDTASLLLAS